MNYEQLLDFVRNRMKVAHVYRPVKYSAVLLGGGCSIRGMIERSTLL